MSFLKRLALIVAISIILLVAWTQQHVLRQLFDLSKPIPTEQLSELEVQEVNKETSKPPPLRSESQSPSAFLTRDGVIHWTNMQRQVHGIKELAANTKLHQAAKKKLDDMFARQYFEHKSPDGKEADALAEEAGYEFIVVGENLALGNFENDQKLVEAWMGSPGHRENILAVKFQEIGVAVGNGIFDGANTWLAVQIFAKPLSACPQPDSGILSSIETNKHTLEDYERQLDQLKAEMEQYKDNREEYNKRVDAYNVLVAKHNELLEQTKQLVATYNSQIDTTNTCLQSP